jgi:DNA-directed RNA polymerase specialized sigma24 family protein
MLIGNSTGHSEQFPDDLVVPRMEYVRKLAWKYADGAVERFEELYSIGLVAMCEAAALLPADCANPGGYIYKAAEYRLIAEVQRHKAQVTMSLDAPLGPDGSFSLGDLLVSPSVPTASSKRVRALNGAIRRLRSPKLRGVLRRRYALEGVGAHNLEETALALCMTVANADMTRHRALEHLRKDARLCKIMGVEVPAVKESKPRRTHTGATARVQSLLVENPDLSVAALSQLAECNQSTASKARKQYWEDRELQNAEIAEQATSETSTEELEVVNA